MLTLNEHLLNQVLWITCAGFPAIGRSKPFLIVIILFALLFKVKNTIANIVKIP